MRLFQNLQPSGSGEAPITDADGSVNGVPLGLSLSGIHAVRVSMLPAHGQTIAPDQQPMLYAWLFHCGLKRWTRAPDFDLAMNAGGNISQGGTAQRPVWVADDSLLYFVPGIVLLQGTAARADEQDKVVVRIEGI
jgi:hypothetical protein